MLRASILVLLALVAVCTFSRAATAQGGYSKEKYPVHGLTFELARDYEWLAIQPSEQWVVLQWVEKRKEARTKREERAQSGTQAKLQVVRIDYVSDPAPVTSGGDSGGGEEKGEATGATEEKEHKEPPPINSWERYLERRLRRWEAKPLDRGKELKSRDGYEAAEYELYQKKEQSKLRGWAYVWENARQRTFVVLGWCDRADWDKQTKIWRHTAEKMRFTEPKPDPEKVKWDRHYERRKKFKDPEYRTRVRLSLDGNWKAEDTENYIVIFNTKDQPLVRRIVRDMESLREEYVELFPPAGEIEAVSTVRICKDRDEYLQYSGLPGSAGYWNYATEELVLYDGTTREKGKKTENLDTFIVLYHEAFHQYIYYSANQLSPDYWFNEGFADYFSGSQIKGGNVKRIEPNPWRIRTVKYMVENREFTPLHEFVEYKRAQYYDKNPRKRGFNYAQGWATVFFLNQSKKVQKHKEWSAILPTYFDVLKATWDEERAKLKKDGDDEDREKVEKSMDKAREAAREAAFEGVDLDELEAEWVAFVGELEA